MGNSNHEHCLKCFKRYCVVTPDDISCCKVIDCDVGCGARFHACKKQEHKSLCTNDRVPCINAIYGCKVMMPRSKLGAHLKYCPASVMCCPLEWNRWPLHSQEKNFKMALPSESYSVHCGQLDMALAMRDQRMLIESFKVPSRTRKTLRNNFTKRYPAAPIIHRSGSMESEDCVSSEDTSRGISDDDDAPWKLGRMPPGLQRSICSKLYQVAKQTANLDLVTVKLDVVANRPGESEADKCRKLDIHISESDSDRSRSSSVEFQPPLSSSAPSIHPVISEEPTTTHKLGHHGSVQLHDILGVDLVVECISKFKSKPSSMYTFLCAQNFRRDEFPSHFKNVHNEIQSGLNGMLEQRCPLAYMGCTFTCRKLKPKSDEAFIVHSPLLESFGLQYKRPGDIDPYNNVKSCDNLDKSCDNSFHNEDCNVDEVPIPLIHTGLNWDSNVHVQFEDFANKTSVSTNEMSLLDMPFEVLQMIAHRLDSFSINNLSMTCLLLREVCCSLLDNRGIVTQIWEKKRKYNAKGELKVSWHIQSNHWTFSTAFTPIEDWVFMDHPSVSDHLKVCKFNQNKLRPDKKFNLLGGDSDSEEMFNKQLNKTNNGL